MPFGSFYAVTRPEMGGKGVTPGKSADFAPAEVMTVQIAAVARNLAIVSELMCSMYQNMNTALSGHKMAFYAPDRLTIERVADAKRRFDAYFRSFSQEPWCYDGEETENQEYHFCLSPSGNQKKAIELIFRCVSSPADLESGSASDAVWLVADGVCLLETGAEDPYTHSLRQAVERLETWEGGPVCLILTQFEKRGLLDTAQGVSTQTKAVSLAREAFGNHGTRTRIIPVQLYGGLDYSGTDENHAPILRLGKTLQIYRPAYCQIPALYTLQQITTERGMDFFADIMEGGLSDGIQGCYQDVYQNPAWTPETVGGNQK